ncbi:cytochrome P450 [Cyathus striatus]|nr:cytochrome P450 [Cyathus striatus]
MLSASVPVVLLFTFLVYFVALRRPTRYPSGPPGLPFLGVARSHPKSQFWKAYAEWGQRYGLKNMPISFHILGRRIVVINSVAVAEDLLVFRARNYSDRPFLPMAGELMKRHKNIFHIPYNERLKAYRKFMHQGLGPVATTSYWPTLQDQAYRLVYSLRATPDHFFDHIKRTSAAITLKIGFGYTVTGDDDQFIALSEEILRIASLAGTPGKWLVDSFPFLRYLPDWFPGAGFKRQAKLWSDYSLKLSWRPLEYVKKQMAEGSAEPSFTSRLLDPDYTDTSSPDHDDIVLHTAGALYSAGVDTTVSVMEFFIYAMAKNPAVQRRAQLEVDSVTGRGQRLPTLQDRPRLPYIECILQETLRCASATPLALSHCTTNDDIYNECFIPAKTTVIPNIWAMLHDENDYPDPFRFKPERFFAGTATPRDPRTIAFGFGRRICPGQHIAESSIFIQIVAILAAYDISKVIDSAGIEIEPEAEFTTGLVRHIKPFSCRIIPRSLELMSLIDYAVSETQH